VEATWHLSFFGIVLPPLSVNLTIADHNRSTITQRKPKASTMKICVSTAYLLLSSLSIASSRSFSGGFAGARSSLFAVRGGGLFGNNKENDKYV
jgi:hypothetical protein